jgi:heme-degrading monooxygenase HmoA
VTLVNPLELAPAAEERHVAAWQLARPPGALYRAIRPGVRFRLVEVAPAASVEAWRRARGDPPDATEHPGLYEPVHEAGAPDGDGVLLIEPAEVPDGAQDAYEQGWLALRDVLAAQRGCLGTRLLRSVGEAPFGYVAVVRWSSPLPAFRATRAPGHAEAMAALPFASHPALYQRV